MSSQETPLEFCRDCGHGRHVHWMGFGQPGTCSVTVDKRHVTEGGPQLWPCDCKGYVPVSVGSGEATPE